MAGRSSTNIVSTTMLFFIVFSLLVMTGRTNILHEQSTSSFRYDRALPGGPYPIHDSVTPEGPNLIHRSQQDSITPGGPNPIHNPQQDSVTPGGPNSIHNPQQHNVTPGESRDVMARSEVTTEAFSKAKLIESDNEESDFKDEDNCHLLERLGVEDGEYPTDST
ncbi:hypothetical protein WN944_006311 [Citrus x changshan-huyou]|uniref:Uncharacterized protein n=1 Tax=Citrus x changshan-huyou TaxID=2935761 RepID=A0AAP0QX31_9ROSI